MTLLVMLEVRIPRNLIKNKFKSLQSTKQHAKVSSYSSPCAPRLLVLASPPLFSFRDKSSTFSCNLS